MDKQIAIRLTHDTHQALLREVADIKRRTGIDTTVSAVVRAAIEQRYAKKKDQVSR